MLESNTKVTTAGSAGRFPVAGVCLCTWHTLWANLVSRASRAVLALLAGWYRTAPVRQCSVENVYICNNLGVHTATTGALMVLGAEKDCSSAQINDEAPARQREPMTLGTEDEALFAVLYKLGGSWHTISSKKFHFWRAVVRVVAAS